MCVHKCIEWLCGDKYFFWEWCQAINNGLIPNDEHPYGWGCGNEDHRKTERRPELEIRPTCCSMFCCGKKVVQWAGHVRDLEENYDPNLEYNATFGLGMHDNLPEIQRQQKRDQGLAVCKARVEREKDFEDHLGICARAAVAGRQFSNDMRRFNKLPEIEWTTIDVWIQKVLADLRNQGTPRPGLSNQADERQMQLATSSGFSTQRHSPAPIPFASGVSTPGTQRSGGRGDVRDARSNSGQRVLAPAPSYGAQAGVLSSNSSGPILGSQAVQGGDIPGLVRHTKSGRVVYTKDGKVIDPTMLPQFLGS